MTDSILYVPSARGESLPIRITDNGDGTYSLKTSLAGDIQIGAVEVKNDSDDTRLKIGAGVGANAARVTVATDDATVGVVNETAPATDTASSGLNGRLQRIAQRLTTLITGLLSSTSLTDASRVPVDERDGLAVSGSVTSAAVLFSQDMLGYESITVQVTSAGSANTITYETSDDNANWAAAAGLTSLSTGGTSAQTTATATLGLLIQFKRYGRYFRARVSTYGSGIVSVVGTLSKFPSNSVIGKLQVDGALGQGNTVSGTMLPLGLAAYTANPTAVTNAQFARAISTVLGAQITRPYSIPEAEWSYAAAANGIVNTTTAVTIASAAGAGLRNYITSIQFDAEALGTATELAIRDGAGGTVLWRTKIGTGGLTGGREINFLSPLKSTANTLLEVVTLTASGTGAVYFDAQGYVAP